MYLGLGNIESRSQQAMISKPCEHHISQFHPILVTDVFCVSSAD